MTKLKIIAPILFMFTLGIGQPAIDLCDQFVPENDLWIPISSMTPFGTDEMQFHNVIDRVEAVYSSIVSSQGGRLRVNRRWTDGTVNASAQRQGSTYIVNMYGGLARHPAITQEGFAIVMCHELGHHLGGAPKIEFFFNDWASNEGQSDYFATLKCMRLIYSDQEHIEYAQTANVDPIARQKCTEVYSNLVEQGACMRSAMGGLSTALLFKELKKQTVDPRFDTPDPKRVRSTDDNHPDTQCRLDTYFSAALCDIDVSAPLSDSDPIVGTCSRQSGHAIGVRPTCWFRP